MRQSGAGEMQMRAVGMVDRRQNALLCKRLRQIDALIRQLGAGQCCERDIAIDRRERELIETTRLAVARAMVRASDLVTSTSRPPASTTAPRWRSSLRSDGRRSVGPSC